MNILNATELYTSKWWEWKMLYTFNYKKNDSNFKTKPTYQNIWDAMKAVFRGKIIALKAYVKNKDIFTINNLTLHLKLERKSKLNSNTVEERKQ